MPQSSAYELSSSDTAAFSDTAVMNKTEHFITCPVIKGDKSSMEYFVVDRGMDPNTANPSCQAYSQFIHKF